MHLSTRLGLASVLFVASLAAQPRLVAGVHEDPTLGFKIRVPDKWTFVPVDLDEKWIVAKYLSNREFSAKLSGGTFKPDMVVTHFSPEKAKLMEKTETRGDTTYTQKSVITFRAYKDWFDQTMQASGLGYTYDVEKVETVGDIQVTRLEMSVTKTNQKVLKVYAWVFDRKSDQSSIAVQFRQLPDWVEKVATDFDRSAKTFKFTAAAASNANGDDDLDAPMWMRDRSKWRELSVSERENIRKGLEVKRRERTLAHIPDGWTTQDSRTKRLTALSHADKKYTQQVLDVADATWDWLDKRFGVLSDDYVMCGLIRICKDYDEYQSYLGKSVDGDSFSETNREIVDYRERAMGNAGGQFRGLVRGLTSSYLYDKDMWIYENQPDWLAQGLARYLSSAELEGKKLVFKSATEERVALREAERAGSLRTFNEVISTPSDDWPRERETAQRYVAHTGAMIRFLESKEAEKLKVFDKFMTRYLQAVVKVAEQWYAEHPAGQQQALTEAEEEQKAKERGKRGKEQRKYILDAVNKEVANFSAKEWQLIEAAWKKWLTEK
jgi:hypothetical protein